MATQLQSGRIADSGRRVQCEGAGRVRGRRHGEQLATSIARAVARQAATIDVELFLAETDFLPSIARATPDLLEEVRGIAEGATQPFSHVLALNLMDEEWWWSERLTAKCTVLGVPPRFLGQTMDLPRVMDGEQTILTSRREDGVAATTLTAAGMIGLTGANTASLAVCVNALADLRHNPTGLPVAFVIRGLLEHRSVRDAVRFLRRVEHASGQHYAIVGSDGAASLECSAAGAVSVPITRGSFWHTNHALVSADARAADLDAYTANSQRRLARVARSGARVSTSRGMRRVLADRSAPIAVLRADTTDTVTFGAVVIDLGAQPRMSFTLGPPGEAPWRHVALRDDN